MGWIKQFFNEQNRRYEKKEAGEEIPLHYGYEGEEIDVIQFSVFEHCGCGMPQESLKYILGAMKLIKELSSSDYNSGAREALDKYFHSDGEKYTIFYILDKLDLTEHGGSVPGWLSEKGELVLDDLIAYLDTEKKESDQ